MNTLLKKSLVLAGIYPLVISRRVDATHAARPKTTGNIVEFLGPSGVGKSTLLEALKHHTVGEWYYRDNIPQLKLREREDNLDGALHWEMLHAKFMYMDKRSLNGFRKAKLMNYHTQVVMNDLQLRYGMSARGFLLDEGLCHNYSREVGALSDADFISIMSDRALVYVKPNEISTVVKRIRQRTQNGGHTVTHHVGLSDDELCSVAEKSVDSANALTRRAKEMDIPVCIVFAEDSIEDSIGSLLRFEQHILSISPMPNNPQTV